MPNTHSLYPIIQGHSTSSPYPSESGFHPAGLPPYSEVDPVPVRPPPPYSPPPYSPQVTTVPGKPVVQQTSTTGQNTGGNVPRKNLFCRFIACVFLPITFLVGTVLAPIAAITKALFCFVRAAIASVVCIFCAPCYMLPAFLALPIDIVGGALYGLCTGGYRLARASVEPEYKLSDNVYPYINNKYEANDQGA